MKTLASLLLVALTTLPVAAQAGGMESMHPADTATPERLGNVSFSVSCSPSVQAPFNRGVALLHDFWYEEAQRQFEEIARTDPDCAMAHWGVAMSVFHQIWERPGETASSLAWREIQAAQ